MANALPSYINAGTATVAANGTVVTGQGTSWLTNVRPGDMFGTHKGAGVRIAAVNSNTSLTLAYPWLGGAQTASAYEIGITPDTARMQETTRGLLETLTNGNLEAFAGLTLAADSLPYATGAGAMGLTPLTAFARSLLDDANAAAARTTLELVKQVSATDATAGRLMGVGAFGLGATAILLSETDNLDNLPVVTAFYNWGNPAPVNAPVAFCGMLNLPRNSGTAWQIAFSGTDNTAYMRVRSSNVWKSWTPIGFNTVSTSNGDAIKFQTGLMICTMIGKVSQTCTQAVGGVFRSETTNTIIFPAGFTTTPFISASPRNTTNNWAIVTPSGGSGAGVRMFGAITSATAVTIDVVAIGI